MFGIVLGPHSLLLELVLLLAELRGVIGNSPRLLVLDLKKVFEESTSHNLVRGDLFTLFEVTLKFTLFEAPSEKEALRAFAYFCSGEGSLGDLPCSSLITSENLRCM